MLVVAEAKSDDAPTPKRFSLPSIDEPGGLANQELALVLVFMIVAARGGLVDFYKMGGTPLEPVQGFEIDDDHVSVAERTQSARQILDRILTLRDIRKCLVKVVM